MSKKLVENQNLENNSQKKKKIMIGTQFYFKKRDVVIL